MARSPLMKSLRRAYAIARESVKTGIPTDELVDILQHRTTRRRLIYGGLGLASAVATTTWHGGRDTAAYGSVSKVLVVGAGIAGLTAAYNLRQAGVPVDIIEARKRIGGRMLSLKNALGTSNTVELGGEFIDTGHSRLRRLAKKLGLTVVDVLATDQGLTPEIWYFQGRQISETEIINYFTPLAQRIEQDLGYIGDDSITYRSYSQAAFALDNTSIAQYLDLVQINPILREMLRVAYTAEYGREPEEQSSLNLLLLIGTETDQFTVFGESDERYTIVGGNDQVPKLLAQSLANNIEINTQLEAINSSSDGRYRVSLRSGGRAFVRTYERILLTLPFSTLRLVALNIYLPPVKRNAIAELGYGTNAKLITSYEKRLWRNQYGSNGSTFTDTGFQTTWEPSRYQTASKGLITNFSGGQNGLLLGRNSADYTKRFLPQLDRIFPGIRNVYRQATTAYWPGEEYTRGAYACYLVGQWTRLAGSEQQRVGNIFFAGEHCSLSFQGYMEGGCRTGEVAAKRILKDLGVNIPTQQEQPITNNPVFRNRRMNRQQRLGDDFTDE
ncbi:flavin monoamine oxidase family protein [Cylindrospermum sp. FACHB-282]|uniref:flavin monoamine oxidase family protein n=1 Tax=Cylindrospermum sp. FACHB-282 TaxID=2692794 RepID=UPI001689D333|nr:NAD(P)/FAD-dependent oxidoreductase [Cylindrospermum sp. FACHB-282]MBD2385920.1 FAD-dependent oxidoreductase [Cylindrospermum sp. FACHB-282]